VGVGVIAHLTESPDRQRELQTRLSGAERPGGATGRGTGRRVFRPTTAKLLIQ